MSGSARSRREGQLLRLMRLMLRPKRQLLRLIKLLLSHERALSNSQMMTKEKKVENKIDAAIAFGEKAATN